MAMGDHEIIDLTASDDREVIVIDSDDPEAGPSRKRSKTNGQGSRTREETEDGANGADGGDKTRKKRRKIDRKKRRMQTAAGEEEGEVVEVDEGLGEASLEASREGTDIEDSRREDRPSSKRREKPTSRSLMDRLGDANGRSEPRQEAPRPKKKKKSKRRKEDDNDERSGVNATADIPLGLSAFFVDDKPAEIPDVAKLKTTGDSSKPKGESADPPPLLLPAHVSVSDHNGDAPVQIIAPVVIDSDDDDYIEYLDYDDDRRAGILRYFDDVKEAEAAKVAKATRKLCKNCGADDHLVRDCPVVICLTCGARDEHSTRGCPISKTCFNCGMKGHIGRDCPNRRVGRGDLGSLDDCDRCGSTIHKTNECPTLWRLYEYVDDAERLRILSAREEKRDLEIGEGGEGYIAPEDWCYNCGGCGHLGDDCQVGSRQHDTPKEPSAFSSYNTNAGPFADAEHPTERQPSRAARYASLSDKAWGDGYGSRIPLNVGKESRRKEKKRLAQRQEEVEDDGDDWFANRGGGGGRASTSNGRDSRNSRGGGGGSSNQRNGRPDNKKISFGSLGGRDDGRYGSGRDRERDRDRDRRREPERDRGYSRSYYDDDLPQPTRETDTFQIRGAASRRSDRDDYGGSIKGAAASSRKPSLLERVGENYGDRYDSRDRDRRRDRDRSPSRGRRYHGGYSR